MVAAPCDERAQQPRDLRIGGCNERLRCAEGKAQQPDALRVDLGPVVQCADGRADRFDRDGRRNVQGAPLRDLRHQRRVSAGGHRTREALQ